MRSAKDFFKPKAIGAPMPPREIPFLQGYFRKAVSVMIRQGQGRLQVPVAPPAG